MNHDPYVFAFMAALILFALYRRFRRLFGRQPFQPARIKVRIALLSLVALLLLVRSVHSSTLAAAGVAGFAAGAVLAYVGLKLTRFERTPGGVFYTPNGYIGAVLSALLLGRLVYRFQVIYPGLQAAQAGGGDPFAAFQRSPLTFATFAIVIGYYLAFGIGLLMRGDTLAELPVQSARTPSPPSGP